MLSLEIFWSSCAAAADYRQIRCRPSIPAAASLDIFNEHNNTSNSVQVNVKFRVRKKVFIYFIFYICLKRMGLNLSTNLPMFVYTFKAMSRHRSLEEYLVFVGIRAALTSFSPFTLGRALSPLPYCDPPPESAPINTAAQPGLITSPQHTALTLFDKALLAWLNIHAI